MTWTTNRNASKQSQIYLADWDHEHALQSLGLKNSQVREASLTGAMVAKQTTAGFEERDMMRHVDYLCRDELAGRMTGTRAKNGHGLRGGIPGSPGDHT